MHNNANLNAILQFIIQPDAPEFIEDAQITLCLTDVHLTLSRVGRALRQGEHADHWYKVNCYWEIRADVLNIQVTRRDHLRRLLDPQAMHIIHSLLISPEALAAGNCGNVVKHFAINHHVLTALCSPTPHGDHRNTLYRHYRALYHALTDFNDATFEPMGTMTYNNNFFPDPLQLEKLTTSGPMLVKVEMSSGQRFDGDLSRLLESSLE